MKKTIGGTYTAVYIGTRRVTRIHSGLEDEARKRRERGDSRDVDLVAAEVHVLKKMKRLLRWWSSERVA